MQTEKNLADELLLRQLALPLIGKWVPFILLLLEKRAYNFSQLQREIPDISRKVLNENLIQLQASGLVSKTGETATGFPVSYQLTELGVSSLSLLAHVKTWLRTHQAEILTNRQNYQEKNN